MERIKLTNGNTYSIVTNGFQDAGKSVKFIFIPDDTKSFEDIEKDFLNPANVEKVYILDSEGEVIRSIMGFTKYKGMEKVLDYIISSETVNTGSEKLPNYETVNKLGTVMIVSMAKPEIEDRVADMEKTSVMYAKAVQFAAVSFTDEQALQVASVYPEYQIGMSYKTGDRFRYDDVLYKVLQDHISQAGWTPDAAPSLYARILVVDSGVIPDWEHPDSTNGYSMGDKVHHNGTTWESLVDNNIWEPGVVGTESLWKEVKSDD